MSFSNILVANRGEIARRVLRTAREMGLRTSVVHVDADSASPFVAEADIAVRVDSYMDGPEIAAAARSLGAQAVHPGYGFLSENAEFAQAVIDAGLVWIGPSPEAIAAMGDKLEAKVHAQAAAVPTLPSTRDLAAADEIGYPLLVKAAAGGGGKGMRVVESATDLEDAVASAQREARAGFGDDTVFLERYVARSRHVEIQIMGDAHGTVVHHGERECSVQRRHQKIIEEAPSPGISDSVRQAMADAAVALGREIGYRSAGTVEFLVDDDTGEFYFLEVNTRLQVEHPVTEMARGIDLVREQIRVAMGEPVTESTTGAAAIEVRLYAEDPANDFLPATGVLHAFGVPGQTVAPGVRWDLGVGQGDEVTIEFDPMIGKVIAAGRDRPEAARRLATALEMLHIGGVITNRAFLVSVLRSPEFLAGDTTTDFIARVVPRASLDLGPDGLSTATMLAALWLRGLNRSRDGLWNALPAGFRNGRLPPTTVTMTAAPPFFELPAEAVEDARTRTVAYRSRRDGAVEMGVGTGTLVNEAVEEIAMDRTARVIEWAPDSVAVELDGIRFAGQVSALAAATGPAGGTDRLWVQMPMGTVELVVAPKFVLPGAERGSGGLAAPMPGKVLDVRVGAGDHVAKGQTLILLEAMKMEHHIDAPADGQVGEVLVAVGDQVAKDQPLLTMVEAGQPDALTDNGGSA